jgi:sugar phosphate isomerase/epimerase
MTLGVSFGGFPETTVERIAELLGEVGVSKVEVAVGALTQQGRKPEATVKRLRERGVEVVCLSTQFPINQAEAPRHAQRRLADAIYLAGELGVGLVNSYSGASELAEPERAVERYIERVKPCVRAAEKAGVTLLIENQIDVAPGNACRRVADMLRILRQFDSPSLRHTYDPANYYGAGEDPLAAFGGLRPYMAHAHLKDVAVATPEMVQQHPNYKYWPFPERPMMAVPAGEGEAPVQEAYRLLADSGYEGHVCTEPFVEEEPLRRAVTYLRALGVPV